jgi:6-phosphogluconolactonase (cycloisomerase 2 family)
MIPALDDGINIETKRERETIQIKTNENLMKKQKKKKERPSYNRNKRDKKNLYSVIRKDTKRNISSLQMKRETDLRLSLCRHQTPVTLYIHTHTHIELDTYRHICALSVL